MRVSTESFDRTWFDGLFWLAIGVEDTFSASLMKYLYRRTTTGRTNTMSSTVDAGTQSQATCFRAIDIWDEDGVQIAICYEKRSTKID